MIEFKYTRPGFESTIVLDNESTLSELIEAYKLFAVNIGYHPNSIKEYFMEE